MPTLVGREPSLSTNQTTHNMTLLVFSYAVLSSFVFTIIVIAEENYVVSLDGHNFGLNGPISTV